MSDEQNVASNSQAPAVQTHDEWLKARLCETLAEMDAAGIVEKTLGFNAPRKGEVNTGERVHRISAYVAKKLAENPNGPKELAIGQIEWSIIATAELTLEAEADEEIDSENPQEVQNHISFYLQDRIASLKNFVKTGGHLQKQHARSYKLMFRGLIEAYKEEEVRFLLGEGGGETAISEKRQCDLLCEVADAGLRVAAVLDVLEDNPEDKKKAALTLRAIAVDQTECEAEEYGLTPEEVKKHAFAITGKSDALTVEKIANNSSKIIERASKGKKPLRALNAFIKKEQLQPAMDDARAKVLAAADAAADAAAARRTAGELPRDGGGLVVFAAASPSSSSERVLRNAAGQPVRVVKRKHSSRDVDMRSQGSQSPSNSQ